MKGKHAKTLDAIFRRPVSGTVKWGAIEALLLSLGAESEEREGSRVAFLLNGQVHLVYQRTPVRTPTKRTGQHQTNTGSQWSQAMSKFNVLKIDGHTAVVSYDSEIEMFRGEFVGLNGSADFYATSVVDLKAEGQLSLKTFLAVCAERGIAPERKFSGTFNVRIDKKVHERAAVVAAARGISLNTLVQAAIEHEAGLEA